MIIQQLSIFLENKSGRLTEVTQELARKKINITALTVAETSDYGILRCIVSDPAQAVSALKEKGFSVGLTDVICLSIPDTPGSIANILQILSDAGISVEYMYAFSVQKKANAIIRCEKIRDAIDVLKKKNVELLHASDI